MGTHCLSCCLLTLFSYAVLFLARALSLQDWLEKAKADPEWVSAVFVCLDVESRVWWPCSSNSVYPVFIQCLFGVCLAYILSEVGLYPGCCGPALDETVFLGASFSHRPFWALFTHIFEARCPKLALCGQSRLKVMGTNKLMLSHVTLYLIEGRKHLLAPVWALQPRNNLLFKSTTVRMGWWENTSEKDRWVGPLPICSTVCSLFLLR